MKKKVLIVGGVAGGASAAARLRRLDENAEIIMFERDEYISFANCGLPYYIGETIKEREKLLVQTPKGMKDRFNIDVRINSEVISIDTSKKTVKISSKDKGIYEESYDYLILSPGAKPLKPAIEGIDNKKILTLRNIPDTDTIKAFIDNDAIKNAAIIGGGYIGIEMAENLKKRGLNVTLIDAAPHILAPFDSDIVVSAEKELCENGIKLILNDGIKSFKDNITNVEITLKSNAKYTADLVILAIGVAPDTGFLINSGIALGDRGHIQVNDKMQTNIENIYAVGDAIEVTDFVNKTKTAIALAGPANKQGRIAADNIAGFSSSYKGTQGTSIIKVFDQTLASTGNNERTLKRLNIPYKVILIHPVSHASYYPEALPLSLKLIFNNEGRILGAQGIGYDGVDKRIDVIGAVMRLNGTVSDLAQLELCYAPPFSSAKDPVNMAGFAAENVLSGKTDVITPDEFMNSVKENSAVTNISDKKDDIQLKANSILLDVRSEIEYNNGHIEGAINIPVDNLRQNLDKLPRNKEIIEYCQVGLRGYIASRILSQNGFKVKNITGGYKSMSALSFSPENYDESNNSDNKTQNNTFENEKDNSQNSDKAFDDKDKKLAPDTQTVRTKGVTDEMTDNNSKQNNNFAKSIDACGLCCPGPLMQVKSAIDSMKSNEILNVTASDPGFYEDIKAWCRHTGNELLDLSKGKGTITANIKKHDSSSKNEQKTSNALKEGIIANKDNKTIVVFSGDLDKAIASFIIANGAASMGKKVTMFFTFWGLNILRKPEKVSVKKGVMDSMFGFMMPRGSKRLKLSNMNMLGMGTKMIRKVMKDKNISSLEDLIKSAQDSGIQIVACQMSMDVMGLKKEELIEGVKVGGVGYYLGEAEDSNVNLFV